MNTILFSADHSRYKSKKSLREKLQTLPGSNPQRPGFDVWKKSLEQKKRFSSLVQVSETELFRARSVFPFDFFPDEISVEATQVSLILRDFFFTETVHSLPIKNITDCILETSPFFGTIILVDVSFIQNSVTIQYLKKSDAMRVRRIIQGLMVVSKESIDLSRYNPKELREHAEKLGSAQPVERSV